MISTKYSRKIKAKNDEIVSNAIKHEQEIGLYEVPNLIHHKMTLSDAIKSLPHSKLSFRETAEPIVKTGSGKCAVLYKRQLPVIGSGNVDYCKK
jgi:hypothetical protein